MMALTVLLLPVPIVWSPVIYAVMAAVSGLAFLGWGGWVLYHKAWLEE